MGTKIDAQSTRLLLGTAITWFLFQFASNNYSCCCIQRLCKWSKHPQGIWIAITMGSTNNESEVADEKTNHDEPDGASGDVSNVNVTRVAARGTLLTLILRLLSFACTQITFRALVPETLGANLGLELLLTTVLFISREGFRLSLTQNVGTETWTVRYRFVTDPSFVKLQGVSQLFSSSRFIFGHR